MPVSCGVERRFVCHGLTTGESYIFKVRALNAAGLSDYSQESEAVIVKAAIGKSALDSLETVESCSLMCSYLSIRLSSCKSRMHNETRLISGQLLLKTISSFEE